MSQVRRRLPVGAELQADGSAYFRVWAPRPRDVRLVIEGVEGTRREVSLDSEGDGYFGVVAPTRGAGSKYRYSLDGQLFADPASRYQPDGPFGPSQMVDPGSFSWPDGHGAGSRSAVRSSTKCTSAPSRLTAPGVRRWSNCPAQGNRHHRSRDDAGRRFPWSIRLGIRRCLSLRPDAAVRHARRLPRVRRRRRIELGLGVILDVVYNHLGPVGCVHRGVRRRIFRRSVRDRMG